jgi:hypothetical protein
MSQESDRGSSLNGGCQVIICKLKPDHVNTHYGNLVEISIPKKFFVCIFILDYVDEDTDKRILRNPNLNEITTIVHGQA